MRNVLPAHTVKHSLTSRLSLSVYSDAHIITTPTRLPPVIRVTALPRALVCHTHTVFHPTPLPRPSVSLSLLATGFPVTPPEPGPAPSSASGFRPSGLLTPVSPGVPTGARNLGVCDFSLLFLFQTPSLVFRLTLAVLHPTSATVFPRVLSNSLLPLSHSPRLPTSLSVTAPLLSFTPSSHAPSCSPRILPTNPTDPPCHPFGTSGEGG